MFYCMTPTQIVHCVYSNGYRYRVQEYDTNRDPRGPLSASAEVFYGIMTDLVLGIARIPGQVVGLFPGSHPEAGQKDYRGRDWAMTHFAECLSSQRQKENPHQDEEVADPHSPNDLHDNVVVSRETDRGLHDTAGVAPAEGSEAHSIGSSGSTRNGGNITMEEGQIMSDDKGFGRVKHMMSETRYHAIKSAKYALNFVLVLPTDLTLSLSKGFHNAPKLYHDETLVSIPKVIGIKSGLRAAGKVSNHIRNIGRTNLQLKIRKCTKACTMGYPGCSRSRPWNFKEVEAMGY